VVDQRVVEVLEEAQRRGFLGPGPVAKHVEHSQRLAEAAGDPPSRLLDLGSGAGIPGLVLALEWLAASATLLDSRQLSCAWLVDAIERLGLGARVSVACGRAEDLARTDLREGFDVVVARSFGPPAVTAECAVAFLRVGGQLVVSEPPEVDETRWPSEALRELGFSVPNIRRAADVNVAVLNREGPLHERWPRRAGIPTKRPLWTAPKP
jgi:16S rRNA (guanine527-N7)-methyltransferase